MDCVRGCETFTATTETQIGPEEKKNSHLLKWFVNSLRSVEGDFAGPTAAEGSCGVSYQHKPFQRRISLRSQRKASLQMKRRQIIRR